MNSVRDPTKTTDWVGMGAARFNSGHWTTRPQAHSSEPNWATRNWSTFVFYDEGGPSNWFCLGKLPYINLLSFTGQHRNVPNNIDIYNNIDNYIGYIVYSTGNYKTYNYDEETLKTDKNAITIND